MHPTQKGAQRRSQPFIYIFTFCNLFVPDIWITRKGRQISEHCITSKPIIPYSTSNSWIVYGFHKLIVKLEDLRLARVYKPSIKQSLAKFLFQGDKQLFWNLALRTKFTYQSSSQLLISKTSRKGRKTTPEI